MAGQLNWEKKDSLEDVKIILAKILRKWYLILLSLILATATSYLLIRYQDEIYVVKASFISRKFDDRRTTVVPELTDAGQFTERIEVNQQIPLLKSEDRISETLRRLNFGITYVAEGRLKATELYKTHPFKVVNRDSSNQIPYGKRLYLEKISENSFALRSPDERLNDQLLNKTFLFGADASVGEWSFKIDHSNGNGINPDYEYYFIIHNPKVLVNQYRNRLNLSWAYKSSAILNASINTKIPEKDYDFLKTYLQVVIDLGLEEKNEYLINSIRFIDDYMEEIADTLLNYQNKIDQFRLSNRDIISGSSLVIDKLNLLEEEKAVLLLEQNYFEYLEEYIRKQNAREVFAPNLIGLNVPPLETLVERYMEIKWQEKSSKNENNELNPLILQNDQELGRLEENIFESIRNLQELNMAKVSEIDGQINFYLRSIDDLHVEYRQYVTMDRMREIYEQLYNQLLARKTDANISKASATSDYQMVTEPYYSNIPIAPNQKRSYLMALIIGLGLPIGLILLVDFLYPKIVSKEDLKRHTDIPVVGTVGHFRGKDNLIVSHMPKSQVAEAFRVIRSNLEYMSEKEEGSKIILITSSISGEGKTFCSTNLAFTYANMGKKTLLLGADMRRPALAKNFNLERSHGLSNFLSGQDILSDVVFNSDHPHLDIITGGHVPPNPAELLTSTKMEELIEFARANYKIIIFDTPPVGLVSDTFELIKHTVLPLLIVRQNVTFKKSLDAITEMYHQGKFRNMGVIMNDINFGKYDYGAYYGGRYGFGNGYGYYESETKKKKWSKLFT